MVSQDLLRFTETNDPDYEALRGARAAVEKVAEHLEGSIKQHETSMAILDLQRSIIGLDFQLISPGRRLLKSGILVKQGRRAEEERAFFLFTDCYCMQTCSTAGAELLQAIQVGMVPICIAQLAIGRGCRSCYLDIC